MKNLIIILTLNIALLNSQSVTKLIDEYIDSYVKTGDFSGSVLITKQNKILYENHFGFANHSYKIENSAQTKYKIGSVSKQFTAAAILLLEEKGLLKTSDKLSNYFPNSSTAQKTTIEQLLTHTSGVTDIYNIADFNKLSCQNKSISDLSKMILKAKLDFEPGSGYQYSNGGYAMLAEIIEKTSGKTYQAFLDEKIFKSLKMNSTGHNKSNEVVVNLAVGYDPSGYSSVKITDFFDPELLKGSGSLYSTVYDLQIWINSLKNRSLLSDKSYDKLLKNYGNSYGYGISVYKSFDQKVFGHDGRLNGYIADYLHYEEPDITIIILGNIQTGVADFFRRDIAAIIFEKDYKSRAKNESPSQDQNLEINKIVGTYAFGPNFKVYIEFLDGVIQARANEGAYSELVRLKDGKYFNRTLYSYIDFIQAEDGLISNMVWTNNDGNSFEGEKEN